MHVNKGPFSAWQLRLLYSGYEHGKGEIRLSLSVPEGDIFRRFVGFTVSSVKFPECLSPQARRGYVELLPEVPGESVDRCSGEHPDIRHGAEGCLQSMLQRLAESFLCVFSGR